MAEVLATQSHIGMEMTRDQNTLAPLPNPHFVFPAQPDVSSEARSHGRSFSNLIVTGARRPTPQSRPQQLSLNALPKFEFSPASSSPVNRPHSPPRSPSRRTPPLYHTGGHRRNGSEFVGGGMSNGGPVLVSSSPTRSEHSEGHRNGGTEYVGGDVAVNSQATLGMGLVQSECSSRPQIETRPTTARRGHAHRRSGAISNHDLTTMLKPSTEAKGGSAPATPSNMTFQPTPPPLDRSVSYPTTASSLSSMPMTQHDSSSSSEQSRTRAVGFSDVLEFIPRPLSTISSETSSSMSTIRASHSVTNSITSFGSGPTSSSPPTGSVRSRPVPTLEQDPTMARPSTAGLSALISSTQEGNCPETESLQQRPSTAPTGIPPHSSEPMNVVPSKKVLPTTEHLRNISYSEPNTGRFNLNDAAVAPVVTSSQQLRRRPSSLNSTTIRPRTSPEPKVTKRQRKRKSFADLLSRKARQEKHRVDSVSRRAPTPPLPNPSPEAELSLDDIDFDNDTTFITETASLNALKHVKLQTTYPTREPGELSPVADDHPVSMLDIDAALGSFDTQSSVPVFEDVVGAVTASKRRMHSSGVTGGFAGPGMHYHRRAESAPELDAIDRSRFGFPRLGSNPAMAIEEEEEEADEVEVGIAAVQTSLGVNIVEAASTHDEPILRRRRRTKVVGQLKPETPQNYLSEDFGPIEIVGADEEPRFSVVTKSSDESTITPTISHDPFETRPASAPFDLVMSTPALTYGTSETPSLVSSPDFNRTSFDVPRNHTANSSITDRATLNSNRTGENGLGLHTSSDDVPSLSSSASTMSARPPRFSSSANTVSSADRSSSLSAAVPARTRPGSAGKRGSLASLTRLVGSSYNRSKLNIEMSAQADTDEPTERSRGHRISRLMKFWKSKEKRSTS